MVSAPKISMMGEAMACWDDVAQHAGLQPLRRQTEAVRLHLFGAERLHHLMAADGLLQDLVDLRGVVLGAAAGAADAAAERAVGTSTKGSTVRLTRASLQSLWMTMKGGRRR